jgi:hypothetical protein
MLLLLLLLLLLLAMGSSTSNSCASPILVTMADADYVISRDPRCPPNCLNPRLGNIITKSTCAHHTGFPTAQDARDLRAEEVHKNREGVGLSLESNPIMLVI